MKKTLVVDGQIFQTPAWHRGMGKYSLELLDSINKLSKTNGWEAIEIILSDRLPNDPEMLQQLQRRLPKAKVKKLHLRANEIGNEMIVRQNRKAIDTYLNHHDAQPEDIDYLVLSLMQGEIYPAFPTNSVINKLVVFYDLIPLMFHDIYLRNPVTRVEYLSKISELLRADKYLAISKTVANDLALYLGIDTERITSIDGGPIDHSKKHKPMAIPKPFILMPTGNDLRKNNRRAILGFEEFNRHYNYKYTLVITSFFKDFEITELSSLAQKVIFTGNVSGDELSYLYDESELLLFPPEYEGLGLPILEALERKKPVVCSDISVFREMSDTAFCYFNPTSIIEIREALEKAIGHKPVNLKAYQEVLARYSWQHSAEKTLQMASREPLTEHGRTAAAKLAIFGSSPSHTSVGKLIQNTHAELKRLYDIDYFLEESVHDKEPRINFLPYIAKCYQVTKGMAFHAKYYQAVIYHLANRPDLTNTLLLALAVPGVLVLHDIELNELWQAAVEQGLIDESRLELERRLSKGLDLAPDNLLGALLSIQKAVVVFSDNAERIVVKVAKQINDSLSITRVQMPTSSLVYESVLPRKTIMSRSDEPLTDLTDYQDNEDLSRTKYIMGGQQGLQPLLEAMVFGVVPCVPPHPPYSELPEEAVLKDLQEADNQTYAEHSKAAITHIRSQHTPKAFSNNVHQIIKDITQNETHP